jgi:hypothetical protein
MYSSSPLHAPRGTRLFFRHQVYLRRYISTSSPKACTIKASSPDSAPEAPTAPGRKQADLPPLSKSAFLNPDRNPLLNRLVRWTLYNHFCPGTNRAEVVRTVNEIKKMGYQGVILGYSKEVVLDHSETTQQDIQTAKDYPPQYYEVIEEWKRGTLETLRMVGPGDFLALKYVSILPSQTIYMSTILNISD